jgi:hypothetical protein
MFWSIVHHASSWQGSRREHRNKRKGSLTATLNTMTHDPLSSTFAAVADPSPLERYRLAWPFDVSLRAISRHRKILDVA